MTSRDSTGLREPTSTAYRVNYCGIDGKIHKGSNIARPKVPLGIIVDNCICSETETCSIQEYAKYYTIKIGIILGVAILLFLVCYIIVKLTKKLKGINKKNSGQ